MRIQKVICDRCGKEISEKPTQFFAEKVDEETGDIVSEDTVYPALCKLDFCPECADAICRQITGAREIVPADTTGPEAEPLTEDTEEPAEAAEKKTSGKKKYDHDKIWELHERGLRNIDIEKELGYPKSTVAYVICLRRKELQKQEPVAEPEVKETKNPVPEPVKKFRYDPKDVIVERSDDGKKVIVTERKPTPPDRQPVKVCMKNCVVCKFSSQGGYCDYFTITGQSRNDKPGICTHRELRK